MISVFLVDDHEVVRRGLVDLLSGDPDLTVVGEAGSVAEAKARIPGARPDVAVLDVRLPDAGHINVEAGFGPWPLGSALLQNLLPVESLAEV